MQTVNIEEMTADLLRLSTGRGAEEIVITRRGEPVARLVALSAGSKGRTPGSLRGRIRMADDFDAPLPPGMVERSPDELITPSGR
jgi:antitoxin (DNA-binding transcriptional repressor) of toxin-antitoxin stability system